MTNTTGAPVLTALQKATTDHEVHDAVWRRALDLGIGYELQHAGESMEAIASNLTYQTERLYKAACNAKIEKDQSDYDFMHALYAELSELARDAVVRIEEIKSEHAAS